MQHTKIKQFVLLLGLLLPAAWCGANSTHYRGKCISFKFPSYIRDLQLQTINNTFGDAVFLLVLKTPIN